MGTLRGLHGAHEARGEGGVPLGIVHRDVSPQNIMIGSDGLSRIADFGIAKASWRSQKTANDQIKGKIGYIAPEQVNGGPVGPWSDVYSCAIVFWEALTKQRLFPSKGNASVLARFSQNEPVLPPSTYDDRISPGLDRVVERALRFDLAERFVSASAMADAIEAEVPLASNAIVASWVSHLGGDLLSARAALLDAPNSRPTLGAFRPRSSSHGQSLGWILSEASPELRVSESEELTRAAPSAAQSEAGPRRIPGPSLVALAVLASLGPLVVARAIVTFSSNRKAAVSSVPARLVGGDASARVTPASASRAPSDEKSAPARAPAAPIPSVVANSAPQASAATAASTPVRKPLQRGPKAADRCQPPYTEDSRGIRHLKLDCLN